MTRYYVFFGVELETRRVEIAGNVHPPYGEWMVPVAGNLLDAEDGFLDSKSYLILDRDAPYTHEFGELFAANGVVPVRLPSRSPNANACAERFVLSIKGSADASSICR